MPQLDKLIFVPQFLYLTFLFCSFYVSFEFFILPFIMEGIRSITLLTFDFELLMLIINFYFNKLLKYVDPELTNQLISLIFQIINFIRNLISPFCLYINSSSSFYTNLLFLDSSDILCHFEIFQSSIKIIERLSIIKILV